MPRTNPTNRKEPNILILWGDDIGTNGFNILPFLFGEAKESPRNHFFQVSDNGAIMALRVRDCKVTFQLQESLTTNVWADPFVKVRLPHIFNLRRDPFKRKRSKSGCGQLRVRNLGVFDGLILDTGVVHPFTLLNIFFNVSMLQDLFS